MAVKKKKEKEDSGMSLSDAFDDDEDVEYAKPKKPSKKAVSKELEDSLLKAEEEMEELSEKINGGNHIERGEIKIKSSKPVAQIKKGDKIKVDSLILEVDAHVVLIDHGSTKEMAIECFDKKTDKDYQIRYFSDQVQTSIQVYELKEIIYNEIPVKKIEW